MELTRFEQSYIETMVWSSTDGDDVGTPLDDSKFADVEFADDTLALIRKDTQEFLGQIIPLLTVLDANQTSAMPDMDHIAHDFWLTRNGHGAGFWDGDYPEPIGEQLTTLAHGFGEQTLYVGDDGKFYLM